MPAGESEAARLVRVTVATAVALLEQQDGLLYPVAHAVDLHGRTAFIGMYNGGATLQPTQALEALRNTLRAKPYRSTAVVFGIAMPDRSGRNALCIELESLDAPAETVLVPFVITRPWLRQARVITYAPIRQAGYNHVLGVGSSASAGTSERTPPREKE